MMLPDPRLMPRVAPKNELIRAVMSLLTESDAAAARAKADALRQTVVQTLDFDDNQALTVALQLAPDQTAYKTLWNTTLDVLETPAVGRHAVVFALPLVLAAGSKSPAKLPETVDADALLAILKQHGVVRADAEIFLSGRLLHQETLGSVSFSQLYRLGQELTAADEVLAELVPTAVPVMEEGVFVRYLVGVALQDAGAPAAIKLGGAMGEWGMPLMQALAEQLKTPGVTLFPIPLVPNVVPEALRQGAAMRYEVNLQMWASNIIKRLREGGVTIVAVAAAHENGELRFTVSSPGDDKNWAGYVWPLAPLDSVERIAENFRMLMGECQIEDVRLVPDVQPDRVNDVPFLITCNDAQAQALTRH